MKEGKEGISTGLDNRVGDAGDARGLSGWEIGNDAGTGLQVERGGRGGERVRGARGGCLMKKVGDMSVVITHDVSSVRFVPGARGVASLVVTDSRAAVVEGLGEQRGVGGRWSFGPHSRVGRGVGINFSRQWWIVRFT